MSPSTPTPPRTSSTPQWSLSKGVSLPNRALLLHWDSVHCRREMSPLTASHRLHRESPASTEPQAARFFQAWLAHKTIWFNVENCTIARSSATQTNRRKPSKAATNFAVIPGMGEGEGWGQGDLNLCSGDFLQSQGHSQLIEGLSE